MKIIQTDNFDRELYPERLVASGISNKNYAKIMCEALNSKFSGSQSPDFYKVVEDDYELYEGFQP